VLIVHKTTLKLRVERSILQSTVGKTAEKAGTQNSGDPEVGMPV